MAIEITPYVSFGPLTIGESTKEECVQLLGEPLRKMKNRMGIDELHYQHFIIRFDGQSQTVRECTLLPYTDATIAGIKVTWDDDFLRLACAQDQSPRDAYGFIVLSGLGVAVTGIHDNDESQMAITAFSRVELDNWIANSVPFEWVRG